MRRAGAGLSGCQPSDWGIGRLGGHAASRLFSSQLSAELEPGWPGSMCVGHEQELCKGVRHAEHGTWNLGPGNVPLAVEAGLLDALR